MSEVFVIQRDALQGLIDALSARGYQVIGPRLQNDAIVYDALESGADLPAGFIDDQAGGHYRLTPSTEAPPLDQALFRYAVGPHSWKRYLFPPQHRLWRAIRNDGGFSVEAEPADTARYAFIGARACELAAIGIQDRVFDNGDFSDTGYRQRRESAFIVAVNCTRAGGTCFCESMGSGPAVTSGFDLAVTELLDDESQRFLLQVGSDKGLEVLADLPHAAAGPEDIETGDALIESCRQSMGRQMPADAESILKRNQEHPRWKQVAERCLNCANCTLVCPTCFCSTVEDVTSLDGSEAERLRRWDSCFTVDFSHIHGGPIRHQGAARYRQWISHKLAWWYDQFGSAGCTGCGRCITWCPVGIDITEEVAAIRDSEGEQ